MGRVAASILLLAVASLLAVAKDQPFQIVSWPDSGQPVLRFTFSKFKELGGGMGRSARTDKYVHLLSGGMCALSIGWTR